MHHAQGHKIITGIDIVVPSYRVSDEYLMPILALQDDRATVRFIIVLDNPEAIISPNLHEILTQRRDVSLVVNASNLGFSAARNKGIGLATQAFVLLLDDDIIPSNNLLSFYVDALLQKPDAIGFAGPVFMPKPFNASTIALDLLGVTTHFSKPAYTDTLKWTPTANVLIRRDLLQQQLFDEDLQFGGEDIALLTKIAFDNNAYWLSVPAAAVEHPWWNAGKSQYKRMFRYGRAATDVILLKHIRPYTYIDFPNSIEWSVLWLLSLPAWVYLQSTKMAWPVVTLFWVVEFLMAIIIVVSQRRFSLPVAWQYFMHKIAREAGAFWQVLWYGKWFAFSRRMDAGFAKPHPSPFRLNRWKIVKGVLIVLGILFLISIRATL